MPSLRKIYERFDERVHILSREMGARTSAKHYFEMLKEHNIPIRRLTVEQKKQVQDLWHGQVKCFDTHELAYSVTGCFDPYICSEMLFRTKIELQLNNFQLKWGWSDKNYFDFYFPSEPMPTTVLRNVNGTFLDHNFRPIASEEALKLLNQYDKLIVKPSIENGFGRSVKLYQNGEYEQIFREFRQNYLIQELFVQHESVSVLNPSSVNVIRVISLNLNGKVAPVNCALRCGSAGSIADNHITPDGRGMFIVGVEKDGTLKDKAIYSCGEWISQAPNGQEFAGKVLPNFDKALEMTTRIHEQLPHFGFIAFDVCLAEDGTPAIMEYNIKGPGILYYQYVNGPLLGDRTQEVIDTFLA